MGGSLHLVNNPSVSHAGTVLGIASGVTGAGVNLAAFFVGKNNNPHEAPAHMLAESIRNYAYVTGGPNFNLDIYRKKPSALSNLLLQMNDEIQRAEALLDTKMQNQHQ